MIRLIMKNLWARRSCWAKLILVWIVAWVIVDPLVVSAHDVRKAIVPITFFLASVGFIACPGRTIPCRRIGLRSRVNFQTVADETPSIWREMI